MSKLSLSTTSQEDGWGPSGVPSEFDGTPYAPFNKHERVGHAADWNVSRNYGRRERADGSASIFGYKESSESFNLVDYQQPKKQKQYGRSRYQSRAPRRYPTQPAVQRSRHYAKHLASGRSRKRGYRRTWNNRRNWNDRDNKTDVRTASVAVQSDWQVVEQFDFSQLAKLSTTVPKATDIKSCGTVLQYNKNSDRVTSTSPQALLSSQPRSYVQLSTSSDPIMQELVMNGDGDVFATDDIIALLMTAPRAVASFDVVVTKIGNKILLDVRDDAPTNLVSVNETASEPPRPEDGINAPDALAVEATKINHRFAQQTLSPKATPLVLGDEWPGDADAPSQAPPAKRGFKYRRFDLNGLSVVVRTQIDAYMPSGGAQSEPLLVVQKALNEYADSNANDWRHKLDSQRGAVLATELKNNSAKLARWTACALLADAQQIKLGYVSRARARDNTSHVLLGAQTYNTADFAKQINVFASNMWGILEKLVKFVRGLDSGKYLLMKDPHKGVLRLFSVPEDAFDNDESDDESDDDESGSD